MEFGASPTFVPSLQIRRRRPTPASLVLSSDQSSPGGAPFESRCHPRGPAGGRRVAPRGRTGLGGRGGGATVAARCAALRCAPGFSPIHLHGEQLSVTRSAAPSPGCTARPRGRAWRGGGGQRGYVRASLPPLPPPPPCGLWGRDVTLAVPFPSVRSRGVVPSLLFWGGGDTVCRLGVLWGQHRSAECRHNPNRVGMRPPPARPHSVGATVGPPPSRVTCRGVGRRRWSPRQCCALFLMLRGSRSSAVPIPMCPHMGAPGVTKHPWATPPLTTRSFRPFAVPRDRRGPTPQRPAEGT